MEATSSWGSVWLLLMSFALWTLLVWALDRGVPVSPEPGALVAIAAAIGVAVTAMTPNASQLSEVLLIVAFLLALGEIVVVSRKGRQESKIRRGLLANKCMEYGYDLYGVVNESSGPYHALQPGAPPAEVNAAYAAVGSLAIDKYQALRGRTRALLLEITAHGFEQTAELTQVAERLDGGSLIEPEQVEITTLAMHFLDIAKAIRNE